MVRAHRGRDISVKEGTDNYGGWTKGQQNKKKPRG